MRTERQKRLDTLEIKQTMKDLQNKYGYDHIIIVANRGDLLEFHADQRDPELIEKFICVAADSFISRRRSVELSNMLQ